ncbi:methyltransferase domain-containing protein [Toxoplasma gondii TgCatPRC2]|uniref:Methyltransferase domain-containing protein n=8 Tax=Toxoplasma gondii TaxID=5811 RepID=A0A0F7UWQ0_TOXGV|nr:methyltransferase domain-containing protein [Toxoplasma gondii ME49]EPT29169.1 methyltransferase domain-containing protein [Toxoplasma gondii ME49]KFG50534.1 methyltransferase domain-containing protein [Toxoplasma gondii p89]KYK67789.1 methyltransferase domain-containing protein [Toxoplasma gondii TgCatPRC2]CEL74637.1 TPA: methyltransferase domain-containing protein [Toxoplasma gondii VEG]|eukprot:XP_002364885.1 methyltransferase domain-containing protein [Toxoplasma gondii ME49]
MSKHTALGLAGATAFGGACFLFYVFSKKPPPQSSFPSEQERKAIFDKNAVTWDGGIGLDEALLGIRSLRKQLVTRAQGDVLEVAAGTGRNFRFYDPAKVKSLVVTDFSRLMLRKALEKKEALRGIPAEFKLQNSAKMKFPDESFDAVVDTFGVCSYEKPVETLQELKRVIKPGGALLLLEHGESSWIYFQKKLERSLLRHVWKFGCYHNRPIRQLVNDAGFDVVFEKRRVFGTIYLIVARKPAKEHVRQLLDRKEEE